MARYRCPQRRMADRVTGLKRAMDCSPSAESVNAPRGAAENGYPLAQAEPAGEGQCRTCYLGIRRRQRADRPVRPEHHPVRPEGAEHGLVVRDQMGHLVSGGYVLCLRPFAEYPG